MPTRQTLMMNRQPFGGEELTELGHVPLADMAEIR